MIKAIPDISKKILVVSLAALFLVSMVFFVSPGNIHADITYTDYSFPDSPPNPTNTPSITVAKSGGVTFIAGSSNVFLPEGTVITQSGGGNFDAYALAANAVATLSSLSGFGSGNDVYGALQWGIPGMGLEFSQPITLTVFIGTTYGGTSIVGQTIYILRSITGTSGWTSDGIVAPATAVVDAGGFITFQATKASTYAATETGTVASTPSKPLTPEEQVLRDLSIGQQVDLYGKTTTGFTKMLYDNILGRVPDDEGLNNWVTALNNGMTPGKVVFNLVFSEELKSKISSASPTEFVTFLYKNVLNREPDSQGLASWVDNMKNGMSKEDVLLHLVDTDEFKNICTMFNCKP